MLIAAGASRELTDVSGQSAIEHAMQGGDARVLESLGLAAAAAAASEAAPPPKKPVRRGSVSSESIDPKATIDTSAIKASSQVLVVE